MKDPAILIYTSDFLTGTMLFTDAQVGKYVRLLFLQHQKGHLAEAEIKKICKGDKEVLSKFRKDENGLYYNERMDIEIEKRKRFCEKQKENIEKRWEKERQRKHTKSIPNNKSGNTLVLPTYIENENVNINTNKDKGVIGGKEVDEIITYLNNKAKTNYKTTTKKTKEIIKARMNEGFKVDDFKTVIDKKCDEWTGREMEKYLRPETLFSNKFEGYLNQKIVKENKQNNAESLKYMQREDTNYEELIANRYATFEPDKPIELTPEQAAERDKVRKIFAMDIKKLAEEKKIDGG